MPRAIKNDLMKMIGIKPTSDKGEELFDRLNPREGIEIEGLGDFFERKDTLIAAFEYVSGKQLG